MEFTEYFSFAIITDFRLHSLFYVFYFFLIFVAMYIFRFYTTALHLHIESKQLKVVETKKNKKNEVVNTGKLMIFI